MKYVVMLTHYSSQEMNMWIFEDGSRFENKNEALETKFKYEKANTKGLHLESFYIAL
jgi:hypothetical protein